MAAPDPSLRRRLLILAVTWIGLGVAASLIGWHPAIGVMLLLIGIVYAVAVLVVDRRRRS